MDGWTWRPAGAIVDGLLTGWNAVLWRAGAVTDNWLAGWLDLLMMIARAVGRLTVARTGTTR